MKSSVFRNKYIIFEKTLRKAMGKKLLHTIGCDENGRIIHVSEAEKGNTYTCPQCGDRIIARNSGKTQRPHFAHFKKSKNHCNGESVLYHLFCKEASVLLQSHIEQKLPFVMEWSCPFCNRKYSKDLLQQVASIETEYLIDNHRTAIVLLDKEGHPLFAIEVLIHKKLPKNIIRHYDEAGIILIQLHLTENDWQRVKEKLSHPDSVTFCGNGECYNFQFYQNCIRREYFSQKFKCKKCGKVVEGYMVRNTSALGVLGLDRLREEEKKEIAHTYFRGKRAVMADILVYGKCRCIPHSKGLVCLNKSDDFKETRQGKISRNK